MDFELTFLETDEDVVVEGEVPPHSEMGSNLESHENFLSPSRAGGRTW